MAHDVAGDRRIDPRIKAILAAIPPLAATDVAIDDVSWFSWTCRARPCRPPSPSGRSSR